MKSKDEQNEAISRLLMRNDVADAWQHHDGVKVQNASGEEGGPFLTYSAAITWLVGADAHLVGMAVCPCVKCIPYIGPR